MRCDTGRMFGLVRVAVCGGLMWAGLVAGAQEVGSKIGTGTPPPQSGSMQLDVAAKPLLSVASLDFLLGTWTADVGPNAKPMGSYIFKRELDGRILARHATTDAACADTTSAVCAHRDLLYVYQDSAGAPLKAIYFDSEGHVIQYSVEIRHEGGAYGIRDYATFLSDAEALGPRFRLTYERNTDTYTKKTSMSGKFEQLLPNGKWLTYLEWGGGLKGEK